MSIIEQIVRQPRCRSYQHQRMLFLSPNLLLSLFSLTFEHDVLFVQVHDFLPLHLAHGRSQAAIPKRYERRCFPVFPHGPLVSSPLGGSVTVPFPRGYVKGPKFLVSIDLFNVVRFLDKVVWHEKEKWFVALFLAGAEFYQFLDIALTIGRVCNQGIEHRDFAFFDSLIKILTLIVHRGKAQL